MLGGVLSCYFYAGFIFIFIFIIGYFYVLVGYFRWGILKMFLFIVLIYFYYIFFKIQMSYLGLFPN